MNGTKEAVNRNKTASKEIEFIDFYLFIKSYCIYYKYFLPQKVYLMLHLPKRICLRYSPLSFK